jgi:hypothetical protein
MTGLTRPNRREEKTALEDRGCGYVDRIYRRIRWRVN